MDTVMAHYGGLPPDVPFSSLHDDLLNDLHETGMAEFAESIGIIDSNGELPDVRIQEEWNAIAEGGPDFAYQEQHSEPDEVKPLIESIASVQQGDKLLQIANQAAAKAAAAAKTTRQRMQQSAEDALAGTNSPREEVKMGGAAVQTPPSKAGRKTSARQSRGSNSAGEPPSGRGNNAKGPRHFSMKALANQVCEKVESKVRTTYNEVADELVSEFGNVEGTGSPGGTQYDEKNIRRRVYDALNVLIAMEIISRQKKEIHWHGLPTGHGQGLERAKAEKIALVAQIEKQQDYLQELVKTQTALRNLIHRNRDTPASVLAARNQAGQAGPTPLQLPFILIQANNECHVEIQISDDSRHAQFDFHSTPFKIHGDDVVIRHMGLQQDSPQSSSQLLPMSPPPSVKPLRPQQALHNLPPLTHATPAINDITPPQLQLQIEADQQLAALQQHSQLPVQRHWGNPPAGNFRALPTGQMNGLDGPMSPDAQMGIQGGQGGSPFSQGPSAGRQITGKGLPATPKSQTLSPALGMAPSPGTLLPHLPLHAHQMPQATLINSPQGGAPAWQYAQANGSNGHYPNGISQSMLPSDLFVAQQASHASHKSHQVKPVVGHSGLSHEPATWNARYDM